MRKLVNGVRATRKVPTEGINFAKGASRTGKNFGKVCAVKSDTLEDSEVNGKERKRELR